MVEIFKTDVCEAEKSKILALQLSEYFPESKINFDLDDCDNILRVEGKNIDCREIIAVLNAKGFLCEVLS